LLRESSRIDSWINQRLTNKQEARCVSGFGVVDSNRQRIGRFARMKARFHPRQENLNAQQNAFYQQVNEVLSKNPKKESTLLRNMCRISFAARATQADRCFE
jgi:hypothetical protein